MSKQQELTERALELANSGMYEPEAIKKIIKADFLNQYHTTGKLMDLYKKLSRKYGKCKNTIMSICNS